MRADDSRETGEGPAGRGWDRMTVAEVVAESERARAAGMSQRAFASEIGVPRSTLRHWRAQKDSLDEDPALVAILESPAGQAFLHRLVLAVHYVFGKIGPCGVPMISAFLKITGLSRFVAASYGSVQEAAAEMTDAIVDFGKEERSLLAAGMPARRIAVAQDENFHEGVCLVAMEPASGFILLEEIHDNREAKTWTDAMRPAVEGLAVTIMVAGSDEAKALTSHIRQGLGAEQAPDIFHLQQEQWRAMEPALSASLKAPERRLEEAVSVTEKWRAHEVTYRTGKRRPGRPPAFDRHIAAAEAQEKVAQTAFQEAVDHQTAAHQAIRRVSEVYHPVDLTSGIIREPATLQAELTGAFDALDRAAAAIHLGDRRQARLDKARRLMPKMVSHLAFFWAHVARCLADLDLSPAARTLAREALIPGLYLQAAAKRAPTAQARRSIADRAKALLARAYDPDSALAVLPEPLAGQLDWIAREAVDLFVRSTSCVEGRNGRLALLHHGLRRLGLKRRQALTVLHNFALHRPDGSTAASRFFHQPHRDLFAYLLDHLDLPARPRRNASQASNLSPGWANL